MPTFHRRRHAIRQCAFSFRKVCQWNLVAQLRSCHTASKTEPVSNSTFFFISRDHIRQWPTINTFLLLLNSTRKLSPLSRRTHWWYYDFNSIIREQFFVRQLWRPVYVKFIRHFFIPFNWNDINFSANFSFQISAIEFNFINWRQFLWLKLEVLIAFWLKKKKKKQF